MNECKTINEVIRMSIAQIKSGYLSNWIYDGELFQETIDEIPDLIRIHEHEIITTNSQANFREKKARNVGWGSYGNDGVYVPNFDGIGKYDQRAYLEMLVPNSKVQMVKEIMYDKIVFTPTNKEQEYNVTRIIYNKKNKKKYYETSWVGTNRIHVMPDGYFTSDLENEFHTKFTVMVVLEPKFGLKGSLIERLANNIK